MRSVVNEKRLSSAVSLAPRTLLISLLTGVFVLTLLASTQASAQHVQMNEYFCAEDVSPVGSCTANEVSLAVVEQVQITDENDVPITACVAGQTIKISNLK